MDGLTIKEFLKRHGFTQQDVAKLLNMSTQNLSAALSKDDVRSSLIERIAEVTGQPVALLYGDNNAVATANGKNSTAVGRGTVNNIVKTPDAFMKEIAGQRKLTEMALEQSRQLLEQNGQLIALLNKKNN